MVTVKLHSEEILGPHRSNASAHSMRHTTEGLVP